MSMKRDVEFLYEIGCLRFIKRAGGQFYQGHTCNLSEHMFRVAWIAMIIAKGEGVEDLGKVTQLALLHDLGESRTGDVNYISRQYVERHEERAIADMFHNTVLEEVVDLWEEAEAKDSLEARCVKDADNLDCDLEFREHWVQGMKAGEAEFWPALKDRADYLRDKLYTETGRKLFEVIRESNPFDWHTNAPNRINQGDWKKEEPKTPAE